MTATRLACSHVPSRSGSNLLPSLVGRTHIYAAETTAETGVALDDSAAALSRRPAVVVPNRAADDDDEYGHCP